MNSILLDQPYSFRNTDQESSLLTPERIAMKIKDTNGGKLDFKKA